MIVLFISITLLLYGVRYAMSGVDNALYYAARSGRDADLPDIHVAEAAQEWAAHGSHFALLCALLYEAGWSWWGCAGAALMLAGTSLAFSPWFNYWIWKDIDRPESTTWSLPIFGRVFEIPKLFAGRRTVQIVVGTIAAVAGGIVYVAVL